MARSVRAAVAQSTEANGGTFPSDLVIACRIGDECFHVTGHLDSAACCYPIWDYSASGVAAFRKRNPQDAYPRGKPWIDVFGRRAYADWLYAFHEGCAGLMRVVKDTLREQGLGGVLTFRNITRSGVFSVANDHDGTGLDLLVPALDIAHLDPYPVSARGYGAVIPVDMSYLAGLARRHGKYLVPWCQAHAYWPERGGLTHPNPEQIARMFKEHAPHCPDAMMWLKYGGSGTFPEQNAASWAEAGRQHALFIAERRAPVKPKLAAIRPYTVRALRDADRAAPQDAFFTDAILRDVVRQQGWPYDPFEPYQNADLNPDELRPYPVVLAQTGALSESGSVFVQISDENVHHVRELMDEVFGVGNFVSLIPFRKRSMALKTSTLPKMNDFLVWYCRDSLKVKFRSLFMEKGISEDSEFAFIDEPSTENGFRRLRPDERAQKGLLESEKDRVFKRLDLCASGYGKTSDFPISLGGRTWCLRPSSSIRRRRRILTS